MLLAEMIFAMVVALLLTIIYAVGFRKQARNWGILAFFAIVFLSSWAGGVWMEPVGPALGGIYWLPFLIVGLMAALLLAASVPTRPPRTRGEALREADSRKEVQSTFGMLAWALLFALVLAVVAHYAAGKD